MIQARILHGATFPGQYILTKEENFWAKWVGEVITEYGKNPCNEIPLEDRMCDMPRIERIDLYGCLYGSKDICNPCCHISMMYRLRYAPMGYYGRFMQPIHIWCLLDNKNDFHEYRIYRDQSIPAINPHRQYSTELTYAWNSRIVGEAASQLTTEYFKKTLNG